jgi:PAS domain-containing protein
MRSLETTRNRVGDEAHTQPHWPAVAAHCRGILDAIPVAAYICDASGFITYFNDVAAGIWGRTPKLGDAGDRYCGSYRLYSTDGAPVRHEESWMARALREGRPYCGHAIVIERADRTRAVAQAHAHPLRNPQDCIVGALNLLADVTALNDVQARDSTPDPRFGHAVMRAAIDTTVAVLTSMRWEKPTFD